MTIIFGGLGAIVAPFKFLRTVLVNPTNLSKTILCSNDKFLTRSSIYSSSSTTIGLNRHPLDLIFLGSGSSSGRAELSIGVENVSGARINDFPSSSWILFNSAHYFFDHNF